MRLLYSGNPTLPLDQRLFHNKIRVTDCSTNRIDHPGAAGATTRRNTMRRVKLAPKGMGLADFVAYEEGFFTEEGLEVELDWKTFKGTSSVRRISPTPRTIRT
jgi:hypothetical protein